MNLNIFKEKPYLKLCKPYLKKKKKKICSR